MSSPYKIQKIIAAAKKTSSEKLTSPYYLISCKHTEGIQYQLIKLGSFESLSEIDSLKYVVKYIINNKSQEEISTHTWMKKLSKNVDISTEGWKEKFLQDLNSLYFSERTPRIKDKIKRETSITWIPKTEGTRVLFH